MSRPQECVGSSRRVRWAFGLRLIIAILVAAGINMLAVYGIVSALGAGPLPRRGLIASLTGSNICLLLLFALLGESVIEDAVKSLVTLLLSFAVARGFKHHSILAIPFSVFTGLALAMITNGYVRYIQRKILRASDTTEVH